jgi:hypothetical protein
MGQDSISNFPNLSSSWCFQCISPGKEIQFPADLRRLEIADFRKVDLQSEQGCLSHESMRHLVNGHCFDYQELNPERNSAFVQNLKLFRTRQSFSISDF